ncbi:MAG: HDOD domain-containing protein [Gammaproteobacteria bacterium]|nr:HDOD domain-containing protein [Gammaproteobacteria bacterium]
MSADEQVQFLQELAQDLNSREIALPSFPDVVVKIRSALEDPQCSSDRLAEVARTDPVLVSRLLVAANSAFHNRAGIKIVDLDLAISRLGFETVRNTAIALAVEQIFNASQHVELRERLSALWDRSIAMSSMCFVIASKLSTVNTDNAFLCGLLNEVGKLYILTRARNYPQFLGDSDSLETVLRDWHPRVGRSIVEAWGFDPEIASSLDYDGSDTGIAQRDANLSDVTWAARLLIDDADAAFAQDPPHPSLCAVNIDPAGFDKLHEAFELYRQSMRSSVGK